MPATCPRASGPHRAPRFLTGSAPLHVGECERRLSLLLQRAHVGGQCSCSCCFRLAIDRRCCTWEIRRCNGYIRCNEQRSWFAATLATLIEAGKAASCCSCGCCYRSCSSSNGWHSLEVGHFRSSHVLCVCGCAGVWCVWWFSCGRWGFQRATLHDGA